MKKILMTLLLSLIPLSAWAFPTNRVLYTGTQAAGTGCTVNILSVSSGAIATASVGNSGGTGYAVGMILQINGGTSGFVTVTTVSGGVVTGIAVPGGTDGAGYSVSSNNTTYVPVSPNLFSQFGTGVLGINGTAIYAPVSGYGVYVTGGSYTTPEVAATITTRASTTGTAVKLYADMTSSTAAGYFIQLFRNTAGTDNVTIQKKDSGTTQLGSTFSHSILAGDSIGLSVNAGTLTLWYNSQGGGWVSEVTTTDSTFTSGKIGVILNSTTVGITQFIVGNTIAHNQFLELQSNSISGQDSQGRYLPSGTYTMTSTVKSINGDATSAQGVLSSSDACVTINAGTETYGSGSITSGTTASNGTAFSFSISSGCAYGHLITLNLTNSASGFSGSVIPIPIYVGLIPAPTITPTYTCSTNYYVSRYGDDGDTGVSLDHALATPYGAITLLTASGTAQGGVCVNVEPGLYSTSTNFNGYNYTYGLSGSNSTSTGWLVYRSVVPHLGAIQVSTGSAPGCPTSVAACNQPFGVGQSGFVFDGGASYIQVDGFYFVGDNFVANALDYGIAANGYTKTQAGAYLTIINNIIDSQGGGGIGFVHSDYITIEGNTVTNTSNTSAAVQTSGISIYQPVAFDSNAGYHNIVAYNVVYNNRETSSIPSPHSDGGGIIMDDGRNTQNSSIFPAYTQNTLIESNLVFDNGGNGYHSFLSDDVTILNNTFYENANDPLVLGTAKGENGFNTGSNSSFINNIFMTTPGSTNVAAYDQDFVSTGNTGNVWSNNVTYNGTSGQASTSTHSTTATISSSNNYLGINPNFIDVSTNNFNLSSAHPGTLGTSAYGYPSTDILGKAITANLIPIGAYKFLGANQSGSDIY